MFPAGPLLGDFYTTPAGTKYRFNGTQWMIVGGHLPKNGSEAVTGNLPMGGNKLTGLANGSAATDSVALGQVSTAGLSGLASDLTGTLSLAFRFVRF